MEGDGGHTHPPPPVKAVDRLTNTEARRLPAKELVLNNGNEEGEETLQSNLAC